MSKESVDSGKILTVYVEYTDEGNTITLKEYVGTLNVY